MQGKIVFKGKTEKGRNIIIRYPKKDDLSLLYSFVQEISKESSFLAIHDKSITLEEERTYLEDLLSAIEKKKRIQLVALIEGKIVGDIRVALKENQLKDVANMGIAVVKNLRGEGIGEMLMNTAIEEAKRSFLSLRIFELEVFSGNDAAINLYKKLGFQQYGRLPNAVRRNAKIEDQLFFFLEIQSPS